MHIRRRVGGRPVSSEARIALAAMVGVGSGQRQRGRILVTGISRCAHSIRTGKDPASHWKRQEEDTETDTKTQATSHWA